MARKKACSIDIRDNHHVVVMGDMEIWDGADLALLRETLARLVDTERRKAIGVDLTYVKYIPSGFFGMLFDYAERGISVRVYAPQPHVCQMLWFREFFDLVSDQTYKLSMRQQTATSAAERNNQANKAPWVEANVPNVAPKNVDETKSVEMVSST